MKATIIVLCVQFTQGVFGANTSDENFCPNESGNACCTGYFESNGTCLECFGSFGANCSEACNKRNYGYQCKSVCSCNYSEVCNKYIGCIPIGNDQDCFGATGENCSVPCENTKYGSNCKNECICKQNEVCNKYVGCIRFANETDSQSENFYDLLVVVIGFGSTSVSLSLLFVGVMFYRWRVYLQRNFHTSDKNKGFQVKLLTLSSNQENQFENYNDVRESRMLVDCMEGGTDETVENRTNSVEYNHLFTSVDEKSVDNDQYSTIDARFRQKKELATFSGFPEDDCYVSVFKNTLRSNRLSKSCSDLRLDMSTAYTNCRNFPPTHGIIDENVLIEHL